MPGVFGFLLMYLVTVALPVYMALTLLLVVIFTVSLADILTVRLVVAGKRRGVLGYET